MKTITLRDIGEDALIQRLVGLLPHDSDPASGPGDDCAVIDPGQSSPTLQLLKTDALVGGIHYLPTAAARDIGWKAIARVVSDFASMGGKPERFLITLALPPETAVDWVEDLYRGMADCMEKFNSVLAGGETSSVPSGSAAVISIAATGSVKREHLTLRSTAKPGDLLFVTGVLGGSITGKHLTFTPRISQTDWLVSQYKPTAMMDLSDGVAKDLPRMAAASGCGFQIDLTRLPRTSGVTIDEALADGEDFEILFSIAQENVAELLANWPFPDLPLTQIGCFVDPAEGQSLSGGWDHFPKP